MADKATVADASASWIDVLPHVPFEQAIGHAGQRLSNDPRVQQALGMPDEVDVADVERDATGEIIRATLKFRHAMGARRETARHRSRPEQPSRAMTDQITVEIVSSGPNRRQAQLVEVDLCPHEAARRSSHRPDVFPKQLNAASLRVTELANLLRIENQTLRYLDIYKKKDLLRDLINNLLLNNLPEGSAYKKYATLFFNELISDDYEYWIKILRRLFIRVFR